MRKQRERNGKNGKGKSVLERKETKGEAGNGEICWYLSLVSTIPELTARVDG